MAPSSSFLYDVFPSFRGEDIRLNFLSHFLKELDRKLIVAFKDSKIESGQSLDPELKQAIRNSRLAVVLFTKNYASSSWCLNELLEIVKCKKEYGQMVIPVFYGVDPSHVRKQTGEFGKIFEETCLNKTKEVKVRWREALTNVANIIGYHSVTCAKGGEANMIEEIADDVLDKLLLSPSNDTKDFVGIEDHISNVSKLLQLDCEDVRMVGIWGSSGIGKTTIARVLFNRVSRHFKSSVFIDRGFLSKSMKAYNRANPDDYNMKLHLQGNFLSKILKKIDVEVDHLGVLGKRLENRKVLVVIDDLDDLVVLESLAGQSQWFGSGSRIIVVTNDKHLLRAHAIDRIYEVGLPSKKLALEIFCRYAFRNNSPPIGFEKLVVEVANNVGCLPLGLNVLGSSLRGRDKEYWMDMLLRLQNGIGGKIEKTLRLSYDGLDNEEDKAIFRHIACLFNHAKITYIKSLLADSNLGVNIGLENLVDKSLVYVNRCGAVEMHRLLQQMGRNIVRIDKPEEREFLVDSKDICDVLSANIGTQKVLGISLAIDKIDKFHVHENAFKEMYNLRFLEIQDSKIYIPWGIEGKLLLPESFDHLPPGLKLLCWQGYPLRCMPSKFRPENLVKLKMWESKLEKLWEGVVSLTCLKEIDLRESRNLKEIPNLSMATNLETLILLGCTSLVELPSSIENLNKLVELDMGYCRSLETLPTGMNLKSLDHLNFYGCWRLRNFPEISTNITTLCLEETAIEELPSNLHLGKLSHLCMINLETEKLWEGLQPLTPLMTMLSPSLTKLELSDISSLVEIPSSFHNLNQLRHLKITYCINLETLSTKINLRYLHNLILTGCSRLRSFPDISCNILYLCLSETGIEEVPWWIEEFFRLKDLIMEDCSKLRKIDLNIYKLKRLSTANFSHCEALTGADLSGGYSSWAAMEADNIDAELAVHEEGSSSPPYDDFDLQEGAVLNFTNCFNLDQEDMIQHQSTYCNAMIFSGEEVPSYFNYCTTGTSLTNIPFLQTCPTKQSFRFNACVVLGPCSEPFEVYIKVCCWFRARHGSQFGSSYQTSRFKIHESGSRLVAFDCCFPLYNENAPLQNPMYDQVDIQFQVCFVRMSRSRRRGESRGESVPFDQTEGYVIQLFGCGIRLLGDSTPYPDDVPNTLPYVGEGYGTMRDHLGGHETENGKECEDSAVEKRSSKGVWMEMMGRFKKVLTFSAFKPRDT